MFWSRWCYFGCDKPCTCSYTRKLRFLMPWSSAYLGSINKFSFLA